MFDTKPVLLKTILSDVSSGKTQLPDFQRNWVWDDERIIGLLESICRGFPVGAIMTLTAGGEVKFKPRPIEGIKDTTAQPEAYILDGQQRLTSLYQSLLHPGPVETQNSKKQKIRRWYYIDMLKALDPEAERDDLFVSVPETKRITKDFGRQTQMDLSSSELEYEHHMMPTDKLLDGMQWILSYNKHWDNSKTLHPRVNVAKFLEEFGRLVLDAFGEYQLPVINLGNDTPKEAVCKVFEKVNTGGVILNVFELVTASFAAHDDDFHLRDDWSERSKRLRGKYGVLQGIEGEHFLQAVALLATNDRRKQDLAGGAPENQATGISCKKETILNLTLEEYHNWADAVEIGLEEAAEFLFNQSIFSHKDVPYSSQIVPLATLFVELGEELHSVNARSFLERWYWSGIFGEFYGGHTETQFALDLRQVSEYVREEGRREPTLVTQASFIPERLLTLKTRNSAAYKGLYALQMKNGAADWKTGDSLSIATWLSKNIDIHHIFPKAWCRRLKPSPIPERLFDSIINKTPIDAHTNGLIGGRGPSEYIPRLEGYVDSAKLDGILRAHWFRPELLRNENFAEFLVERGLAMLELIGEAMGKQILGGEKVFRDALSSAGIETQYVEDDPEDDEVGEIGRQKAGLE